MGENVKHQITVTDRKIFTLAGVQHVGSFDEKEIALDTNMGFLMLKGEDLHITQLNLDTGDLEVEGFIHSIAYIEGKSANKSRGRGIMNRLLK